MLYLYLYLTSSELMLEKSIPHVCLVIKVALISVDTWTLRISGIGVREMVCRDIMSGVWCVMSATMIFGPITFLRP